DLSVGLRLPARFDAAFLLVHCPIDPNDLAHRRRPRRDPARRRLGRVVAALARSVGDGVGDVDLQCAAVQETADLGRWTHTLTTSAKATHANSLKDTKATGASYQPRLRKARHVCQRLRSGHGPASTPRGLGDGPREGAGA